MVSIDDYKELHAITKKWIDEKRAAAQSREFPHSVEELEGLMVAMNKVKSKEMPTKKRDMKSLGELYGQLQELKAKKPSTPAIPSEMEYSKLEEVYRILCIIAWLMSTTGGRRGWGRACLKFREARFRD